ncbi:hypothetical protein [Chryseobacterium cheonjiense]|uniref:Uncharacterized protein n=1 Tax=Chryseobacterium cheonjiense TaxID=2728845 RepID=A0A7Y0A650_9FLAO|nr:hypothetical protein [Chryseobacterium cheonjiense]NML57396.1 hypothetical protein [Chryseobacterium cheonjiense]
MKINPNLLVTVLFFLTFLIHLSLWKFVFHLDEVIIVKFYLFLSIMFMMMITLIILINRVAPEFLGLSVIGLILLKFALMYLIRKKLNFEAIPSYKFHFIIPYFVLTTLLTYYAIKLINHDKKQEN